MTQLINNKHDTTLIQPESLKNTAKGTVNVTHGMHPCTLLGYVRYLLVT